MDPVLDAVIWQDAQDAVANDEQTRLQQARIERIKAGANEKQLPLLLDPSHYKSLRCPRRSGKSFAMSLLAVFIGETRPGARILIISLTLKSTRENFWEDAPSGIWAMNRLYNLGLTFNKTDFVWHHQNGSRGRLAGAETRADVENLRGSAVEADVVLLDECKSFAPALLEDLMTNVIEPGLMTRSGTVVMGGTPGHLPVGPFYAATATEARRTVKSADLSNEVSLPTCVPWEQRHEPFYVDAFEQYAKIAANLDDVEDEAEADEPWSLHSWSVKDNTAWPKQWRNALKVKKRNGWGDDHPTWRREYLGEWVYNASGMVYAYATLRHTKFGEVTWIPERSKDNLTGLPPEDGPWHLVMGLDIGFEDDTALVLAAYSERLSEYREVHSFKKPHMIVDDLIVALDDVFCEFGMPDIIVADTAGGGSKMLVETLAQRYGLPMVKAEKTQKNDHIELVNSDFHAGRIKVIPGSELDHELCELQWAIETGQTKGMLAHQGKLKEDPKCPNHACDAMLYSWRYSYHFWAQGAMPSGPEPGTDAWVRLKEAEAEAREFRAQFTSDGYPGARQRPLTRDTLRWQQALNALRPN